MVLKISISTLDCMQAQRVLHFSASLLSEYDVKDTSVVGFLHVCVLMQH